MAALLAHLRSGRHWLDAAVAGSRAGKYFEIEKRRTNFTREVYGGIVTFLTAVYILALNSSILAESGGPCNCSNSDRQDTCTPQNDPKYQECLDKLRQNLITATAASSIVACFIMGAFANMPVILAPGLGLNAYFAYNVVGYHGSGSVSYETALAAVFVEGWIFILLSVTGARAKLITYVPRSIALSMSAGIGMFLAFVGLQWEEGLGVATLDTSTLVTLGGCPVDAWKPVYYIPNGTVAAACADPGLDSSYPMFRPSQNHICNGHKMTSATTWLGISGLAVMTVLMHRGFKGSVMIGILFVTFISWIPGHGASYLGSQSRFPGGIGGSGASRLSYLKKVVQAPSLDVTGVQLDFHGLANGSAWLALITFLYVDFLDATGTLFSMANFLNSFIPGFVNRKKQFPKSTWAFSSDGCGIVVGSLMGTSPVTAYIESATGIKEGARTGIAALAAAFCFLISLFFNPIIASIPPYATGPAIVLVGSLMMVNVVKIRWNNVNESVPAFLTMIVMPLTYSIAFGVVAGLVGYIVANTLNLSLDWVGDRLWEWRTGQKRGPRQEHSASMRARRDRTFSLHRTDSSQGGDGSKGAATFASPGQKMTGSSRTSSFAGGDADDDSHFQQSVKKGGTSRAVDGSVHLPMVDTSVSQDAEPDGPSPKQGDAQAMSPRQTSDSAVELTRTTMQQPPAAVGQDAEGSVGGTVQQGVGEPAARSSVELLRPSIPPCNLTSDELEAMAVPAGRSTSDAGQIMRSAAGTDMYSTDSEVVERALSLSPRKKSVSEAYEDLWS